MMVNINTVKCILYIYFLLFYKGSEGDWHDMRTLEPVDFMSIPWRIETEPTGYTVENCTGEQWPMS